MVDLTSDRPERVEPGSVLFAGPAGGGGRRLEVVKASPHGGPPRGPGAVGRWIVAFAGVSDREGAEALHGLVLSAPPLAASGPDTLWVHELVGAEVADRDGRTLGRVAAVEVNPASDLLVLEDGGLVPMRFVVGSGPGRVVVDSPAGLLG